MDNKDQPLDDWNVKAPPLSLWSRPDWTTKHKAVAKEHGHVEPKKNEPHKGAERVVSNYLMEENKPHEGAVRVVSNYLTEENQDCYNDFSNIITDTEYRDISTILDDVPEEETDDNQPKGPNPSTTNHEDTNMTFDTHYDMVDMVLSSPVISSTNSVSEPRTLNPPFIQPSYYEDPVISSTSSRLEPRTLNPPFIQPNHYEDPVIYSTNSRSEPRAPTPPFIQPNHGEHHAGYGPPHYTNTSVPYGTGIEFGYPLLGQTTFPSHPGAAGYYVLGDYAMTSMHPPYGNFGYSSYPPNTFNGLPGPTNYNQPDFTCEPNVWLPGTTPPDYRSN